MQIPRRVRTQRRWIGIIDPAHRARPADTDKSDVQLTIVIEIPRRMRATRPREARDEGSFLSRCATTLIKAY